MISYVIYEFFDYRFYSKNVLETRKGTTVTTQTLNAEHGKFGSHSNAESSIEAPIQTKSQDKSQRPNGHEHTTIIYTQQNAE